LFGKESGAVMPTKAEYFFLLNMTPYFEESGWMPNWKEIIIKGYRTGGYEAIFPGPQIDLNKRSKRDQLPVLLAHGYTEP
jgi:hypothetical protein